MKQADAQSIQTRISEKNDRFKNLNVIPVKVRLKPAIRSIAGSRNPLDADSFVVHSPNEVFDYINSDT